MIDALARRGVQVSATQLERWRSHGWIPRNRRVSLGRGRGSTSVADPETIELAEALAIEMRQGCRGKVAVLEVFIKAAGPYVDRPGVRPCPPEAVVRAAIDWQLRRGLSVGSTSRPAHDTDDHEQAIDAAYAEAERAARRLPSWHPEMASELRAALEGVPYSQGREMGRRARAGAQQLMIAATQPAERDATTILEAAASFGLLSDSDLSVAIAEVRQAEMDGRPTYVDDLIVDLSRQREAVRTSRFTELQRATSAAGAVASMSVLLFLLAGILPEDKRVGRALAVVERSSLAYVGKVPMSPRASVVIPLAALFLAAPLTMQHAEQLVTDLQDVISGHYGELIEAMTTTLNEGSVGTCRSCETC